MRGSRHGRDGKEHDATGDVRYQLRRPITHMSANGMTAIIAAGTPRNNRFV